MHSFHEASVAQDGPGLISGSILSDYPAYSLLPGQAENRLSLHHFIARLTNWGLLAQTGPGAAVWGSAYKVGWPSPKACSATYQLCGLG